MRQTFLHALLLVWGLQSVDAPAQDKNQLKRVKSRADGAGNGGDLCENRIKTIREDIESWILRGGSASLKLPQGVSGKDYKREMLEELRAGYPINCTEDSVRVGKTDKTCKNYEDSDGVKRIKCHLKRFMDLNEEEQYKLIHHEYAGLAGFEVNTGEESHYFISNQLTSYLKKKVVKRLAIKKISEFGIELVRIEKGTFMMGSPESEAGRAEDEKLRRVTISYDFEMMTTEVTQELYMKVTGLNPSYFKKEEDCPKSYKEVESDERGLESLCPHHPVESVSFNETMRFIDLLNAKTGMNYRLPTEAEWEFAARGGRQTAYSFSDDPRFLKHYAIYQENSKRQTEAVGPMRKFANRPNRYGLYDMHGNVWEWTKDRYSKFPSGGLNPTGPKEGSTRVSRGGSWSERAHRLRSAHRYRYAKDGDRLVDIGFRLVRTLP